MGAIALGRRAADGPARIAPAVPTSAAAQDAALLHPTDSFILSTQRAFVVVGPCDHAGWPHLHHVQQGSSGPFCAGLIGQRELAAHADFLDFEDRLANRGRVPDQPKSRSMVSALAAARRPGMTCRRKGDRLREN